MLIKIRLQTGLHFQVLIQEQGQFETKSPLCLILSYELIYFERMQNMLFKKLNIFRDNFPCSILCTPLYKRRVTLIIIILIS